MPFHATRCDPAWAWASACASLGLVSAMVWVLGLSDALAWQSGDWAHQPWTLWTAGLAHLSGAHLLGNLAALGVLAVLGSYLNAGPPAVVALLASWPVATGALQLWPAVTGYRGMSGLLCAALAVLWSHAVARRATRAVSWVLLATVSIKLLSEQAWAHPVAYDPHWGFNVVYAAHLAGFAAGAACGLVAVWRVRSGEPG